MLKPLSRLAIFTLLAASMAGCGLNQPIASLGTSGYSADSYNGGLRYALGARLTGRKVIDNEANYQVSDSLPETVDLRSQCSPVANQGRLGACTAFAIVKGLDEFLANKAGNPTELSPAFLYYEERKADGNTDMSADTGALISTGMQVLEQMGTCPESDDPYISAADQQDPQKIKDFLATPPSDQAVQDAIAFEIPGAHSFFDTSAPSSKRLKPVPLSTLTDIRTTLAGGMPVVAGIMVYQSMESQAVAQTGMVPMPTSGDKLLGGHAILLVGYDETRQLFIVRNSWGSSWGDGGYFYLPYQYVAKGYMQDAWTADITSN